jgi:uncharacterized membrane protein YeaQ/YmgE (transglycosylase-associated protein family)
MASSADLLNSGAFSLSRIFWSNSVEPTGKALFAVSGDQVKGMHRLVLSPSGTQAEPRPGASQEAAESQASTDYGSSRVPVYWKKRFSLEVERHQRDWGIVTAVMLGSVGGVAGTAVLLDLGVNRGGGESNPTGFIVGLSHLVSLGFLAHYLNTANLTLVGIKGVVASSHSAEEALRRMHRARIGTGIAALILAGLGTALLPLSAFSNMNFEGFVFVPIAVGCGGAALTLLSISSAHWALEVDFEKSAARGSLRSTRKAPAVRVAVTPTGIVGWF